MEWRESIYIMLLCHGRWLVALEKQVELLLSCFALCLVIVIETLLTSQHSKILIYFFIRLSFIPFLPTIPRIQRILIGQMLIGQTSKRSPSCLLQLQIWNIQGVFVYSHAYCSVCSYMFNIFLPSLFVFCRRSTTTIPTVPSGITRSGAWWDTGPRRAVNCWKPTRATPLAPAVTWPTSPFSWLTGEMW